MKKKLILIELNEINFDILKKYSIYKNFKFFNKELLKNLRTTSSETVYENLEPWIQWVSIHTGLSASEHKIFRLGDINNSNLKQIFETVEANGYQVSAICPMNTKNNLKKSKYFIPDPWTKTSKPKNIFQNIIYTTLSEAVNDNSKNKLSIKNKIIIFFLSLYFFKGKSLFTFIKYYFKSIRLKWYRAIIFDYLLHKIHISYLKKFDIDFSTIFFNAGAHIQHHYLHNSKVIEGEVDKNPNWYVHEKYDPILDVYSFYDEILSDYIKNDHSILIATGLTQNPFIEKEYYYRLKNHQSFIKNLKINFKSIYPRMSRDFLITFRSHNDCLKASKVFEYINEINKIKFFDYEIRENSIFVIFCYNKRIDENLEMKIDINYSINLYESVNFVALKNGDHNQKGYLTSFGEFKNFMPPENSHVKELFYSINNFFGKK
tara:strand:+ start:31 stop:1326 length:1296 start_codon:yes stop_codon:yes gene_type:complete